MSDNNEKELKYISPFKYQLLQSFPFRLILILRN